MTLKEFISFRNQIKDVDMELVLSIDPDEIFDLLWIPTCEKNLLNVVLNILS